MDKELGNCLASLRDAAETVRSSGEFVDLVPYVADFSDLCNGMLSDEDISYAIALVFDEDTGLFSIIESLVRDKSVAKAREACWTFLASFIEKIGARALPYSPLVKEKSLKYLRRDESKLVQAAALTPLIVLLESNMTHSKSATFAVNQELTSMLMLEFRKSKASATLKAHIIRLLGDLVEFFKESFVEENVSAILKLCLDSLEKQRQKLELVLMAGAIKCLDCLLTWFDDSLPAGGSVENSRRLFIYIEEVLRPQEELKRYEPLKACLRLLSRHAGLFSLRLIEEGVRNMHWLQEHCTHTNAKIRDAALPAYDQFITQVSSSLVSDNRIKNAQTLYKAFVKDALDVLDSQDSEPKRVSLSIRAVGKLAAAIVKFSGKESLMEAFHRLEPFGTSTRVGEGREGSLGYAVTLVGAFADMVIHVDYVEDFMVIFIAQVTGNIFYQFPQLFAKQKQAVYTTLRSLLKALYSKGTVYSVFLNNIVWSSLQRAMEPVDETPEEGINQLWSHYVELWSHLLEFSSDRGFQLTAESGEAESFEELVASDVGNVGINETTFRESVFDAIMHCIIKAMTELNLKYRVRIPARTATDSEEMDAGPNEPEAEMDLIEPLDLIHMRKFLNLVDFVQGLVPGPCAPLLQKWTHPFGRCVIELSSRYPLISGFYKLLAVTITTADHEGFFVAATEQSSNADDGSLMTARRKDSTSSLGSAVVLEEDRRLCKQLFSKYLQEVLVASRRYKLELLAACLRLCLSAPPVLVGIDAIVPSLKSALKIGLRYLPLAEVALDALERWQNTLPDQLQRWLPQIVPCLNDYLFDVEKVDVSEAETPQDIEGASTSAPSIANMSRAQLAQIKKARAKDSQPAPFEIIQVRIQKFLGRIGGFAHSLVSEVDLLLVAGTGGLAWDTIDRVKFTLPFRQDKPDIWLDSLLSRIVEIALSSSDRRMKVTACELLQAVCLLMLGNAAKGPMRRRGEESQSIHFDKIYKRIFPAILRLSTDVEMVTRQLFSEFAKQLVHWFTSNQQKENPDTMALLDAILDGLVDPENGSLREFCADCFSEFMRWSVRHAPPEADNFVNVTSMLRRVYNRMDHPNSYHRLGAAMAVHRMYPVLRENGAIVDRYIFEILFFCIKSLKLGELDDEEVGTVKQMNKTVDLLQRLISRYITLLLKRRRDRPLFLALEDFLSWVFEQTGLLQEKSRTKCMMLFCTICQSIPGGSSAEWFRAKFGSGGGNIEQFDVGMKYPDHPSLQQVQLWLTKFIRSIHWFEWALKENLISLKELLDFEKDCTVHIASSISAFLQSLLKSQDLTFLFRDSTPAEQDKLQKLRCDAVIYLLNFFSQVLNAQAGSAVTEGLALRTFFMADQSRSFQDFLCLVLLKPRRLGFFFFEPRRVQDLAKLAMKVVKRLTGVSSMLKSEMIDSLRIVVGSEDPAYDLDNISLLLKSSGQSVSLNLEDAMSLVKGYQQLSENGILQAVVGKVQAEKLGERLLLTVFRIEQECPPSLQPIAAEMLELAMGLGVKVTRLVGLVLDAQPVAIATNRKLTAGEIFYTNFRIPIVHQLKFYYNSCLRNLLELAIENQTAQMLLLALLDDYSKPGGTGNSITKHSFLREFLRHVAVLTPVCRGSSLPSRQFVLEILHRLLILDTGKDVVLTGNNPSFTFITETFMSFLSCSSEEGTNSSFGSSAALALKTASMSLLPFFFSANVDSGVQRDLTRMLTDVVTNHLLIREADIPKGSIQRSNYTQLLNQLLGAMSVSRNLELLEVVFPLLQSPNKISSRAVSEAIEVFAEYLGDNWDAAFNLCLTVIKDSAKSPRLRRAILEVVFGAFVSSAPAEFVSTWYAQHISDFFYVLEQRPSFVDAERQFEDLSSKICHYGLVERLYSKADNHLIKKNITPVFPNVKLMTQASKTCRGNSDRDYNVFPENLSILRELHAAAYNCLTAVILCTQEAENVMTGLLFSEKTHMLWQHLVDLSKVYDDMPVEMSQSSIAFQTIKGMRADRKAGRTKVKGSMSQMTATISSQYISASLSQEPAVIKTFVGGQRKEPRTPSSLGAGLLVDDDSPSTEADEQATEQEPGEGLIEATALDRDDFDQHECMGVVLQSVEHFHVKFGAKYQSGEMPLWMKSLYATLENAATHINVRLFLAKVITKARKIFAPYSTLWIPPYMQTILIDPRKSGGLKFHYMLRDICITILQWNVPAAPDCSLSTKFIHHLISVAAHGSNQVLRANIDIIRLFLENWKGSISLERGSVLRYLIAGGKNPDMNDKNIKMQRAVGLQLLGAIVASGFPIYDPVCDSSVSEEYILEALMNNLNVKTKEVYEAAAELLGIAVKYRREKSRDVDEELLEKKLHRYLKQLYREAEYERFFNILGKVTTRDPYFLEGYAAMVVDQLPRLFGTYKVIALDTLLRYPKADPNLFNQISRSLPKLLTHRDEIAQLKTLQLLSELLKDVTEDKISERVLPVLCDTFNRHESVNCKRVFYDILMYLFKSKNMDKERLVIHSLLMGLCDSSDTLRSSLQNFWHLQLSQDVGQRFSELVNQIYDPGLEESWAQISNVLMLKLCEDSVDYMRPIFTAPLSECVFHDYTINTSWVGASLPMTPLFASTQLNMDTQSTVGEDGDREFGSTQHQPRMIRATMVPSLSQTPTQSQGGSLSSTQGVSSSALFALSQRGGGAGYTQQTGPEGLSLTDPARSLQRRFLSPRLAHSKVLSGVLQANRRREARSALQSLERANKVHIMRQYRIGELPDIEIKHADIVGPLTALAERDPTFARLLLTILCSAVYSLPSKGPDIKAEVRQGLEAALQRTNNGISFVGCVETLCLLDPEIWIPPKIVGSASHKSTNFHSGIMLLEKEILNETFPEPEPNMSGKRHKGRGGQINRALRPLEDAWLELAELYKALGENDIVLGLFGLHIAKHEKTHRALECQLGGNLQQALALYDNAVAAYEDGSLGGDVTKSEIEIWYNQRLACLADLSEWKEIMNEIVFETTDEDGDEPDFKRLWEPKKQEDFLGYFVKGALKESKFHAPLTEFVRSSLDILPRRQILLNEFSTQLATLAAINKEWDRARFYLGQCYRVFRRQWSALHPLALEARHVRVWQLQKTVELEEFITFISSAEEKELPRLLGGWHKRWPSAEFDGVEAWDDVAQNRLLFLNHLQEHFNQQVQRVPTDEDCGDSLFSLLNAERANLYIQIANGLMGCGAFSVSLKYINGYMDSTKIEFSEKYRLDFSHFKALVNLYCLRAERADSTRTRIEMLQKLLNYIQGERANLTKRPDFLPEFQMIEADVNAQFAWATLSSQPREGAIAQEVTNCYFLLGSAYKAYSTALAHNDSLSEHTVTTGILSSQDAAKALLKFGLFCDELYKLQQRKSEMTRDQLPAEFPETSELPQLIVRHMLKALALDSTLQAQHAVARLLSLVGLSSATQREFEGLVENVSNWVFVPWIPQMLANVEEESGPVLVKVLESIARSCPQALYFPFHVSEADFRDTGQQRTQNLKNILRNPLLHGLVRALEDLTYPEQRLKDGLLQIRNLLFTGDSKRARLVFTEICQDCLDSQALKDPIRQAGEWNLKFAREWAPHIMKELGENETKLQSMDVKRFSSAISGIIEKLAKSDTSAEKLSLGTLSKWLADFDQTKGVERVGRDFEMKDIEIEIPGQYNSFNRLNELTNVRLVGFDQVLVCLKSKQRPKILTMRGSDENDFKFVVKGGEDLRLDQRIEQLFEVMNNVLNRDAACSQRKLAVRTYSVVPVSKKCGLLQFVENTCVLEDIIRKGLWSKFEGQGHKPGTSDALINDLRRQYMQWVQEKGGSKNHSDSYCNMYRKVGFKDVSNKLSALQAELPWDTLRTGFSRLVTSAESYLALRSHFARSLSVVSICGYVAGVGDRHLGNTLVDMRSGALVPIDFGYSFGTSVLLLPVPELVPFRLTSQLKNFLLPLNAVGLLRHDMVRIMSALQGSRALISAVMEVFVKEPLVDWKQEAVKLQQARARDMAKSTSLEDTGASNLGASSSEEEHVHLKVETAQYKLNLWNPADITISELRSSVHANKAYMPALEAIVRGDPSRNIRARVDGTICATVQEQVDCLLDQATDPNLLGRIFVGWQPWV